MAGSEAFREFMREAAQSDASVAVLVEEACRVIDRLDELDGIITGKTEWIRLMHFRVDTDPQQVTVTIDGVLAEARQQASTLDRLMTKLGVGKADLSGAAKGGVVDPLDEIAARRSARGVAAAGQGRPAF